MVEAGEKALVILYRGQRNWCPRHNEASAISGASKCQQKGYTSKYVASYIHCSKVSQLRVFDQVVLEREFSQWWRVGLAICDGKMVGLPISTDKDVLLPSPFLNLSGAPASTSASTAQSVQNAAWEFMKMWRDCITDKEDDDF